MNSLLGQERILPIQDARRMPKETLLLKRLAVINVEVAQ